jgi:hypothetical protein
MVNYLRQHYVTQTGKWNFVISFVFGISFFSFNLLYNFIPLVFIQFYGLIINQFNTIYYIKPLKIALFTVRLSKYFVEKQPWLAHYFIFSKKANI